MGSICGEHVSFCNMAMGMKINLTGGYCDSNLGPVWQSLRKLSQKYEKYVKHRKLSAILEQIKYDLSSTQYFDGQL